MLYVRLLKALYGLLQSALLFYRKLRSKLEDFGFEVNPYDPCVAKNGERVTDDSDMARRRFEDFTCG